MKNNPMSQKKWGVMCHYLERIQNNAFHPSNEGVNVKPWSEHVDDFDVEKLAKQLYEIHAGYFMITMQQGTPCMIAPNTTYDRLCGLPAGWACSKRDLVLDIYEALKKYDIDLYLYFTSDGPCAESNVAIPFANAYNQYGGFHTNEKFIENWSSVLKEYAERYKGKVKGWWIDGCYENVGYNPDNLKKYYEVLKAADENYMVAFNDGATVGEQFEKKEFPKVHVRCPYEDYTAGEVIYPTVYPKDSDVGDKQWHILIPIAGHDGFSWGANKIAYEKEAFTKYFDTVIEQGGVMSIDIALTRSGGFLDNQRKFLKEMVEGSNWWKNRNRK